MKINEERFYLFFKPFSPKLKLIIEILIYDFCIYMGPVQTIKGRFFPPRIPVLGVGNF